MLAAKGAGSLLSLLWLLVWVLIIIGLAYVFTKYVVGRGKLGRMGTGKGQLIEVITRMPAGKEGQLLLVQVGGRYFLLGQTAAGITNLAEFTQEEAAAWKDNGEPPGGEPPPSFGEALKKAWKQRVKR